MSNEQEPVNLSQEPAGQASEVSEARRRWVKGSLWTAPVLLTLPRISSAIASNQQCVEPRTGGLIEADAINPGGTYVTVSRPTYTLNTGVTVVYDGFDYSNPMPDPCTTGNWRDTAIWANIYTPDVCPSPTQFTLAGVGTYTVTSGPGTANVIVQVDASGVPQAIGPTGSATYVITASCWTSALPGGTPL
jgi:hypothetical protein